MTADTIGPLEINDLFVAKLTRISSTLDRFSNYFYDEIYPETNLNDARYLLFIGSQGEGSAADIVRTLNFDKTTVSRNISRLIKKGLLCKTQDHSDGRRSALTLTAKGLEIYKTISIAVRLRDQAALSPLTAGEQMILFEILEKLQTAANHRLSVMEALGVDPAVKYEQSLPAK